MGILKFDRDEMLKGEMAVTRKYGNKTFQTHWHNYYEIIMYKDCSGFCVFNGVRFEIEGTCIFFLTPTDFHRIETTDPPEAYSINVSFSEAMIDKKLLKSDILGPHTLHEPSVYLFETVQRLFDIFKENEVDKKKKLEQTHLLNLILIMILQEGKSVESKAHCVNPSIRNALLYILTDISSQHLMSDIAAKCGLSPSHFSYLFHKEMGVTYKNWLDGIRIKHAKRLLENDSMKVLEVSLECGFNSPSHFIRAFREVTGQTPSQYKKSKTTY